MTKHRALRRALQRTVAALSVLVAAVALTGTPALAYSQYSNCWALWGPADFDHEFEGCVYVRSDSPHNADGIAQHYINVQGNVYRGPYFGTGASRCAMKMTGQFKNAAGGVWNIPDKTFLCNDELLKYDAVTHYIALGDTAAVAIRPWICAWLYYPDGSEVHNCVGPGTWINFG